ncbi:Uncharacterized protein TPAR_00588 [Tolypocladium paradoxum]|uniref:Initiation-specific alpha-1,6-mannosyltransferase n=1 Tax=Tolypocladium paradoxum TaxID=94208 RepID=A0A2S4L9U2_9HYPO|nr:Uncharacterized protein TPAR_00588 [Tolypocladium paradoxum]
MTDFELSTVQLSDSISWLARNPGYDYHQLGDAGAKDFVRNHFGDDMPVQNAFNELRHTGMKSDLLRYLLMLVEGGVYTDIDTVAYRPIDVWVPDQYRKSTRVVIGIIFDRLDGPNLVEFHRDLQFCQWTIAATPGHPVFRSMVQRAVASLKELAISYKTTLSGLQPTSLEVMQSTGAFAWTDAVLQQLQLFDPSLSSLRQLSGLQEPRLVGDILILPIDGFGMGQLHSNSTLDKIPAAALLKHKFRGTWRGQQPSH